WATPVIGGRLTPLWGWSNGTSATVRAAHAKRLRLSIATSISPARRGLFGGKNLFDLATLALNNGVAARGRADGPRLVCAHETNPSAYGVNRSFARLAAFATGSSRSSKKLTNSAISG